MPGRPKEFDRSDALASATECFWANGYEASGVTDLLDCMGISRQSAYDTFGDKRKLFKAALEAYSERVAEEMRRVLTDERQTPLGRVREFLRLVGKRTAGGDGRGCLITNT
ncbi:MAG TPA: TetR/AcrR family transcriptional regulator, partial [Tepidisphaeraceae bacterium]|nr:TetR/AcrR family transcriptional regulator [Tepidisphaeraceae bacterium]